MSTRAKLTLGGVILVTVGAFFVGYHLWKERSAASNRRQRRVRFEDEEQTSVPQQRSYANAYTASAQASAPTQATTTGQVPTTESRVQEPYRSPSFGPPPSPSALVPKRTRQLNERLSAISVGPRKSSGPPSATDTAVNSPAPTPVVPKTNPRFGAKKR
jgi:hypothetical protein